MEPQIETLVDNANLICFQVTYPVPFEEYRQGALVALEVAIENLTNQNMNLGGYNIYDCRDNPYSKLVVYTRA